VSKRTWQAYASATKRRADGGGGGPGQSRGTDIGAPPARAGTEPNPRTLNRDAGQHCETPVESKQGIPHYRLAVGRRLLRPAFPRRRLAAQGAAVSVTIYWCAPPRSPWSGCRS